VLFSSDPNSSLNAERHRSDPQMNTARVEGSPTELQPPEASGEQPLPDVTLVRGRPVPLQAAPRPHIAAVDDDVDDSPIARLILSHDRAHPSLPSTRHPSLSRTAERAKALPVTVLTTDAAFVKQMRSAVDTPSELTVVSTPDEAAELAVSGRCPILVTDGSVTRTAVESLTARLRAHDPALVVIVAGGRDQAGMLIGLQSSGAVDGFLLKPLTAGATQVVIEAATKRYRASGEGAAAEPTRARVRSRIAPKQRTRTSGSELAERATPTIEARVTPRGAQTIAPLAVAASVSNSKHALPRPSWPMVVAAVLAVGAIVWWVMWRQLPDIDAREVIAEQLTLAESAQNSGRLIGGRQSAAYHFQTVLALDPQNLAAQRGLDRVAAELSRQTQTLMSERRLAEAAASLERLRDLQPDYAELPLLDAQLRTLRDAVLATHAGTPVSDSTPTQRAEPSTPARQKPATRIAERAPAPALPVLEPAQRSESRPSLVADAPSAPAPVVSTARTNAAEKAPTLASTTNLVSTKQSAATPLPTTPSATVPPIAASSSSSTPAAPKANTQTPVADAAAVPAAELKPAAVLASATLPRVPAVTPPAPSPAETATGPSDGAPTIQKYVPPVYPHEAYARGLEGWVQVGLTVTPGGSVSNVHIEDGDKRQLFSRAALAAVKQWKYEPRPQATSELPVSVRLDFKLDTKR
jgi:periplasmic protein TonB